MQRAPKAWQRCDNLNHLRPNAPIRNCPQCGGLVNDRIRATTCDPAGHAIRRKQQNNYCVACGDQLIAQPPPVR